MLSFAGMLLAPIAAQTKKESQRGKKGHAASRAAVKANTRGRYRLAMEDRELTTGEIACARNISHMGALSTLYELEKEGLVERAGTKPNTGTGKPTIVWRWKK